MTLAAYALRLAAPWWLAAALLAVPLAWLGARNLPALGRGRQIAAIACRAAVVVLLAAALARPSLARRHEDLTLVVVLDRSQSVPQPLREAALNYLTDATAAKPPADRLAIIDVAEAATLNRLPSNAAALERRNTTLAGEQSRLADGLQLAMAIADPQTATRLLLVSDGNQTSGELREAARTAAANHIPIDVLPLAYRYEREVSMSRLVAPARARPGATVALRFVLNSTVATRGRLLLSVNGRPVDLDPSSGEVSVPVELTAGTNVKTVSLPLGGGGMHEFEAHFVPDKAADDKLVENNRASAMTFVAAAGEVLVVDAGGPEGQAASARVMAALASAKVTARRIAASELGERLAGLLGIDAIVLVNVDNSQFSHLQQEVLVRYVKDLGGGLVMTGGPDSFGAGGWIGSPVAEVIPVDLDPPQKKQMPKGALVMVMHACEMPKGNYWGKQVAIAAVNALSRLDLVGVVEYGWGAGGAHWVYKLAPAGDKKAAVAAIRNMDMGDMPDFGTPMAAALTALQGCQAGQKHVIIISDGDPQPPSGQLIAQFRAGRVTVSGVGVFPHSPADVQSLSAIAAATGGRFYNVQDPAKLPQIFVKEAQVVRRSLIVEKPFTPRRADPLSETIAGLGGLPALDGYVLTGPKGGLTQLVLTDEQGDPVLATGQAGLGRAVAFTSSADSRWAGRWLAWGGFDRFWEQVVRWAAKSARSADCDIYADVQGRSVILSVESAEAGGRFTPLGDLAGQVIAPDMSAKPLSMRQVGPGQYRAAFRVDQPGSFLVNLSYRKAAADGAAGQTVLAQSVVTVPYAMEFEDLTDNSALLAEVAQLTGGRVLGPDPARAGLFDRGGVQFPETARPLTATLLLIWLGLFLLDVAVRRIAVDWRAVGRRVAALAPRRRVAEAGRTLAQLRHRRRQLAEQMAQRSDAARAGRRFQADPNAPDVPDVPPPMPISKPDVKDEPDRPPPGGPAPKPPPEQPRTTMDQLLQSKRKRKDPR